MIARFDAVALPQVAGGDLQTFGAPGDEHQAIAARRQHLGEGPADAGRSAGDERRSADTFLLHRTSIGMME